MADYATLLRDHVTLKCRCIDRMFFQAYVPKLQSVGQVCTCHKRDKGKRRKRDSLCLCVLILRNLLIF